MKYRPEIDGLRSLAIVPVILFHAGFSFVSGGFVGVDIFFVISGYLIASIILSETRKGDFSYLRFYERRVRRILPALVIVTFFSLVASLIVSLPDQAIETSEASIFAILGLSNIYYWTQSGYFAPASDFSMLLHTWSLGVEEQFYILLAPLLLLIHRLRLNLPLIIGFSLPLMFIIGLWLSFNKPSVAFYLLPARAWELGLGVALAVGLFPPAKNQNVATLIASLGFISVIASVFFIDKTMAFPGWAALLPCLGTAALIHSASGENVVGRILSIPPLRFIGIISYSLYLWHWPVFVTLRIYTAEPHLSVTTAILGIAASFALSVATWKLIETPFRSQQKTSFKRVMFGVSATSGACFAISLALIISAGFPDRLSEHTQELFSATGDTNPLRQRCPRMHAIDDPNCYFGDANAPIDFVVLGDSHAGAIQPAIEVWAKSSGRSGTIFWKGACPTLIGAQTIPDSDAAECTEYRQALLEKIEMYGGIKTVLIAGRWEAAYSGIASEIGGSYRTYLIDEKNRELSDEVSKQVFESSILRTATWFETRGMKVIIIGAVPEIGFDVPRTLALASHNQGESRAPQIKRSLSTLVSLDEVFERIASSSPNFAYVSIWQHFCKPECALLKDGIPLYYDDDHITYTAALSFLGPILKRDINALEF